MQEKEGRKELKRGSKEPKSAKGRGGSDADAQHRAGLKASYMDIKNMLGQGSSGSSDSSEVLSLWRMLDCCLEGSEQLRKP